jgi:hypothetical protein
MARFSKILVLLTAITVAAVGITSLVASPETDESGAQIGNVLVLAVVGIVSLSIGAVLLRRIFHGISAEAAIGLLSLSAVISALSLALLIPSEESDVASLAPDRVLAIFFLFALPGLLIGLLVYAVLPRRS